MVQNNDIITYHNNGPSIGSACLNVVNVDCENGGISLKADATIVGPFNIDSINSFNVLSIVIRHHMLDVDVAIDGRHAFGHHLTKTI